MLLSIGDKVQHKDGRHGVVMDTPLLNDPNRVSVFSLSEAAEAKWNRENVTKLSGDNIADIVPIYQLNGIRFSTLIWSMLLANLATAVIAGIAYAVISNLH